MKRSCIALFGLAFLFAATLMGSCDSRTDSPPTPAGNTAIVAATATAPEASQTAIATPAPKPVLGNGVSGYASRPQLAYIDPARTVWLVNGDGSGRVKLLEECTGMGSAKRGDVLTGGLVWSADGSRIACWREDLSVLTAKADGTERATAFGAGECDAGPRWAPAGDLIACDVKGYVDIRAPSGTPRTKVKADLLGGWAWSPSGTSLIVSSPPRADRGVWTVYDLAGRVLADIPDAYVASPAGFGWTLDGTKLAYPGLDGVTVIDLAAGGQRRSFPAPAGSTLELGTGPQLDWIHGEKAVLAHNFSGAVAFDIATGVASTMPTLPSGAFWAARLAPDGYHLAFALPGNGTSQQIAFADLKTSVVQPVANSDYVLKGIGLSPQFTFSGDSKRLCWTLRPSNEPEVLRAEAGEPATKVAAPVQVEPDVLGRGDPSVLWPGLSPDLSRVASTMPGLAAATSPQTLKVANPDGSSSVTLGPALGPLTYSWRPDGVYRAPVRN